MLYSSINSLKIKAKLLQKAKKKAGQTLTLKDSFSILAKTAGYDSWKEMKDTYELGDILNPPRWSAMWKIWFSTKEEALLHFNQKENYLLPYQKQFFICDMNYVNALGLSEDDIDLQKIGRDWSSPNDKEAWTRVLKKITQIN